MRATPWLAFVFCCTSALAQSVPWSAVSTSPSNQRLAPAILSQPQLESLANLLRRQKPDHLWNCEGPDLEAMIEGLQFETLPSSGGVGLVLASAPAGCARGGQGANGAMWIIRFDGERPSLLATPGEFGGWLYSVLPAGKNGYPDIVLGWHMGAGQANLSYFRFDGNAYRLAGTASWIADQDGNVKIVPNSP